LFFARLLVVAFVPFPQSAVEWARTQKEETRMVPDVEQAAIEKLRTLSPEQQGQVLEFIEGLETPAAPRRTIWDKVKERMEAIPPEAWDEVPKDGAANVDHYLYGAPKKS
jgi:hypothetical protein